MNGCIGDWNVGRQFSGAPSWESPTRFLAANRLLFPVPKWSDCDGQDADGNPRPSTQLWYAERGQRCQPQRSPNCDAATDCKAPLTWAVGTPDGEVSANDSPNYPENATKNVVDAHGIPRVPFFRSRASPGRHGNAQQSALGRRARVVSMELGRSPGVPWSARLNEAGTQ